MDDGRHRLRLLDDGPTPPGTALPLPDAVLGRLRNAALLERLVRRSLMPAALVGVLLAAWMAVEFLGPRTMDGQRHPATLLLAGANLGSLLAAEPWRLVAAILLHAGAAHFVVNATGTWFLSQMSDNVLGWARTVVIYVAGGALSFVASAAVSATPSVGASGSVYALLGALLATAVARRRELPPAPWRWLAGFAVLWGVLTIGFAIASRTTDTAAHAGGFLAGALLSRIQGRRLPLFETDPPPTPRPVLAAAALCLVAVAASMALSIRGMTLHADLPDPDLRQVALRGVTLPLPAGWAAGRLRDHRCVPEPGVDAILLAADGPLCLADAYGSILVLGRAVDVLPGVVLDPSMTAQNGLRTLLGDPEGDVLRRWLVLDREWTLAFTCYTVLASKYDGMLQRILAGMRLRPRPLARLATADPRRRT